VHSVPVNIICGALGSGKTTAIANLLANKLAEESWVVILNEFTDTGLDTLTLATAARGRYDVRMIPGGCLCCTGEEDFRRQLSSLVEQPTLPTRILIEPSGVGHPGSIIEELRLFERSGAIKLCSTIALIEPQRIGELSDLSDIMRDQIDAADVLLLSKAELASASVKTQFQQWADSLFPPKRLVGTSERGVTPTLALSPPTSDIKFSFANIGHRHHAHDMKVESRNVSLQGFNVTSSVHHYLNREGCGWVMAVDMMFSLEKLQHSLSNHPLFNNVERFKAVLRTGIDRWYLLQRWNNQTAFREISWRNDNRIEVQMQENMVANWAQWDEWIESILNDD